jgi:hypothetical protein
VGDPPIRHDDIVDDCNVDRRLRYGEPGAESPPPFVRLATVVLDNEGDTSVDVPVVCRPDLPNLWC